MAIQISSSTINAMDEQPLPVPGTVCVRVLITYLLGYVTWDSTTSARTVPVVEFCDLLRSREYEYLFSATRATRGGTVSTSTLRRRLPLPPRLSLVGTYLLVQYQVPYSIQYDCKYKIRLCTTVYHIRLYRTGTVHRTAVQYDYVLHSRLRFRLPGTR